MSVSQRANFCSIHSKSFFAMQVTSQSAKSGPMRQSEMLFEAFERVINQPDAISPDSSLRIEAGAGGVCVVDGLVSLPLESVSHLLPRGQTIEVTDESNAHLADLLICEGETIDIPRFSAHYLAAYLLETEPEAYGQSGKFQRNHLLVSVDRLEEYK